MVGEQAVAEKLADHTLSAAPYSVFDDAPGTGDWNIDHVFTAIGARNPAPR